MYLPNSGAGIGNEAGLQGADNGEKFPLAKRTRTTENGFATGFDQPRHATNVVVMPMGRDDQDHGAGRIQAEALQVAQRSRRSVLVQAGIDEDPRAVPDMQGDALAVTGAEKGKFDLVVRRRRACRGHNWNDRIVSSAHASPARKSDSVNTGRSRSTIWDTRFLVPAIERS